MLLSASGCATNQPVCHGGQIIYLAHEDLQCMSRGTKQQILTNNETVEKQGGAK